MPEVFQELERYYDLQWKLRKRFLADITWPLIQFVMAIFVITALILVLGWIGSGMDPLGFGLTGEKGAVTFLLLVGGGAGGGVRRLPALDAVAEAEGGGGPVPAAGAGAGAGPGGAGAGAVQPGAAADAGAGLAVKPALRRSLGATATRLPARLEGHWRTCGAATT